MGDYYGVQGGSGSAATYNQHTITGQWEEASYTTGGFTIDLSVTFSSLNFLDIAETIGAPPSQSIEYVIVLNSPSAGKAKVKMLRHRYEKVTAIGNSANAPSGVTIQTVSGQTSSSESSHTHAIDHDHGSFNSGSPSDSGVDTLLAVSVVNLTAHTHELDLPNLTGASGAGGSHNHTDNTIYQHSHDLTYTGTDETQVELTNGTSLAGIVWDICAMGVKA